MLSNYQSVEEMKEFAVIIEKYNNNIAEWLFEILAEYDDKMRAQFLFFTSGKSHKFLNKYSVLRLI